MSLLIEDEATVAAIRRLADMTRQSPQDVVKRAVEAETGRDAERTRRREALRRLQDEVASWPSSGLKADKAFFDDLGGGL